jgi:hypothetical protein
MPIRRLLLVMLLLAALPSGASAQSDDASYCSALAALANRYLTGGTSDGRGYPDLETRAAINECAQGRYAKGIPVLERKLRANGFTLPKR